MEVPLVTRLVAMTAVSQGTVGLPAGMTAAGLSAWANLGFLTKWQLFPKSEHPKSTRLKLRPLL